MKLYHRLVAKKGKKTATKAVARKLAVTFYTLVKKIGQRPILQIRNMNKYYSLFLLRYEEKIVISRQKIKNPLIEKSYETCFFDSGNSFHVDRLLLF